ncbi:MAG: terminase, partial [Gemmatimonadales bacterium]|nr:terminase [Gemmatimonadales bacterium]
MANKLARGRWRSEPHLEALSDALFDAATEGGKRIIVSMPPRHGKSELTSHWFPVWYLDRFPDRQLILASYAADFASDWGRKVRNTMAENAQVLRCTLAEDSKAANKWNTTEGGGMVTAGIGGPITGRGAHVLIIDDPVKNLEDAYSAAMRAKAWEWYQSTAYTRLEPNASVVVVMTRWHEDDLVGRLLRAQAKGEGDTWEVIRFPALSEGDETDLLGRPENEPLWPDRYDAQRLERIRRTVGPLVWAGLYQQNPVPSGYELFPEKAWQHYTFPPPLSQFSTLLSSWDFSF